jgi:hypothetical protein
MSRTRDLIQEIIDVRNRRASDNTFSELLSRLSNLEQAFEKRGDFHPEVAKYFPVALVACIEGFFRLTIKELINTKEAYLDSATKLLSNIKFDFNSVKALHGKKITIGDFISHQVSINSLESIDSHLSTLLGKDFLKELPKATDRWARRFEEQSSPILKEPDKIYADVARTFELRHIICHELATKFEFSIQEIERCFLSTVLFLKASEEFLSETLYPNAPLTQLEMNETAAQELNHLLKDIELLNQQIKSAIEQDRVSDFSKATIAWQSYMEQWAEFIANYVAAGGSAWPTIYAGAAAAIARPRINELKECLDWCKSLAAP